MGKFIGNYEVFNSRFGQCKIEIAGYKIRVVFEDQLIGNIEAELTMQEYCNEHPQVGKYGANEVQKCSFFDEEFVSEIH